MPVKVSTKVMEMLKSERHTLSLSNFAEDLMCIADRLLDIISYNEEVTVNIEGYDVVLSDGNFLFTVLKYDLDNSENQPCVLHIRTEDGNVYFIDVVIY